jgi:deoxyribonuclease-4
MHLFGAHIGTENLITNAKIVKEVGGNFVQIFLTPPGHKEIEHKDKELQQFKNFLDKNSMRCVVHSSYMHNLARDWDPYSWWIVNLELEIQHAHTVGAIGVVVHFGKKLLLSTEEGYNNMYSSLVYIHNKTKKFSNVKIFLETSTGQGTELCYKIEDLAYFYKKIKKSPLQDLKNRIKLCVDTCHIFSAGYDLRNKTSARLYLETFEELIGLHYIQLIHMNDSKVDLGSQVDRHASIGNGYIGYDGLKYFFDFFKKLGIPMVLETPDATFVKEIPMLLDKSVTN